jgi:hypothetical protein
MPLVPPVTRAVCPSKENILAVSRFAIFQIETCVIRSSDGSNNILCGSERPTRRRWGGTATPTPRRSDCGVAVRNRYQHRATKLHDVPSSLLLDLQNIIRTIFAMGETTDQVKTSVLHGVKELKIVSSGNYLYERDIN